MLRRFSRPKVEQLYSQSLPVIKPIYLFKDGIVLPIVVRVHHAIGDGLSVSIVSVALLMYALQIKVAAVAGDKEIQASAEKEARYRTDTVFS